MLFSPENSGASVPELAIGSTLGEHVLPLIFLLLFVLFAAFDIGEDLWEGELLLHLLLEGGFFSLILSCICLLWLGSKSLKRKARTLQNELVTLNSDRNFWRDEASNYLQGLGVAIDQQFSRWNLTEAEKDIALMLLKGFSHKEIAELRQTSDRTIRQQSASIYRKSNLEGRAQLAAFFLEDLLLPSLQITHRQKVKA